MTARENGPCVCARVACEYSSDYMCLLFSPAANEAGETPLDIARRLRHLQCEELVSSLCLDVTSLAEIRELSIIRASVCLRVYS